MGRREEASELSVRLLDYQQSDGKVIQAKTSITSSGGESLDIEVTSITILVWLEEYEKYTMQVENAMNWLSSRCADGKFGSTQGVYVPFD